MKSPQNLPWLLLTVVAEAVGSEHGRGELSDLIYYYGFYGSG